MVLLYNTRWQNSNSLALFKNSELIFLPSYGYNNLSYVSITSEAIKSIPSLKELKVIKGGEDT